MKLGGLRYKAHSVVGHASSTVVLGCRGLAWLTKLCELRSKSRTVVGHVCPPSTLKLHNVTWHKKVIGLHWKARAVIPHPSPTAGLRDEGMTTCLLSIAGCVSSLEGGSALSRISSLSKIQ